MIEYKISGASDDLILISSDMGYDDELDALSLRDIEVYDTVGTPVMIIHSKYNQYGCWSFSVSVTNEDNCIPEFIHSVIVDLKTDRLYSTGLTILSDEPLEFNLG